MFGPGQGIGLKPMKQARRPYMERFHSIIKTIATSSLFTSFIMFIIGINAIIIGLETVEELKVSHGWLFDFLDYLFLAIYTAEFFIKVYADSKGYWKSVYNIFDFVILALSFIQVIMDQLNVGDNILGVFRLLRALRTLRTISFIEGLQVLVTALIDTIRNSVLNVVILLALLMLFFGVVGYYIFGYDESGDQLRWGTLNDAMLTLFAFVTADGWTDIQKRLAVNYRGSQWFTVVFIFLGHFIFTNLFIGIIIMNIHEATERFLQAQRSERESQLKLKKEYLYKRQHEDVKQMLEKQKTSQYTNFQEMTKSFFETLRHDDYVIMKDVCTSLLWLETYIDSLEYLDLYAHRIQQCHRNLVLALSEMAERHFKKQYGLLIADDLQNEYLPFPPVNRKKKTTAKLEQDGDDTEDGILKQQESGTSLGTQAKKVELPRKRKLSLQQQHHQQQLQQHLAGVSGGSAKAGVESSSSQQKVPLIFVMEDGYSSKASLRFNKIDNIIEEEEDEEDADDEREDEEINGDGKINEDEEQEDEDHIFH